MPKDPVNKPFRIADTKRCPYCSTPIPRHSDHCFACNSKVGDMGKFGLAKKPFDWKGYFLLIFSVIVLGLYIWWAFFKR